ncbi:MAG: hypothetical protein HQL19_02145 [Candidatus Omnitrophica bacterium]|nr:hypothetical protein [Candidatus Omnitrophota bacterium]
MDKNKKLLIALPFLMTTAVIVLLPNFKRPDTGPVPGGAFRMPSEIFPERKELVALLAEDSSDHDVIADADWGARAPFYAGSEVKAPLSLPESSLRKLPELSGVLWHEEKPCALLNDRAVGIGDRVDGFIVKEIRQDRVILTEGKTDRTILLHNSLEVTPPQSEAEEPKPDKPAVVSAPEPSS